MDEILLWVQFLMQKKCLKEFSITCLICFENLIPVHSLTSNLDQKYAFFKYSLDQTLSGPQLWPNRHYSAHVFHYYQGYKVH